MTMYQINRLIDALKMAELGIKNKKYGEIN
jgi:hypothetical protein